MSDPLKLFVLGLDDRARNLFRMFFRGPCQNQAVIVEHEKEADAFLIDLDTQQGAKLLAQYHHSHPGRVIIVLSIKEQAEAENIVFVKKPAQAQSMIAALDKVSHLVKSKRPKEKTSFFGWRSTKSSEAKKPEPSPTPASSDPTPPNLPASGVPTPHTAALPKERQPAPSRLPTTTPLARPANAAIDETSNGMKIISRTEKSETAVHKVAMLLLDEQGFKSYLGHREDIDPKNPEQLQTIFYDPKEYLQGHLQSAIKVATARNEPMRLETPWKSLAILPEENLVQIAADDAQIRAACGIPFRNIIGLDIDADSVKQAIKIRPITRDEIEEVLNSKELVRLDSFLWKVALLTSKGRLPKGTDVKQGFYLKRWPGMTRLMLPPHAMRIAAIFVQKPFSLFRASESLGIRQQYVFAFISAAHALGLIGQQTIAEVAREPEIVVPEKAPERKSLFQKILSRLKLI